MFGKPTEVLEFALIISYMRDEVLDTLPLFGTLAFGIWCTHMQHFLNFYNLFKRNIIAAAVVATAIVVSCIFSLRIKTRQPMQMHKEMRAHGD